MYIPAESEVQKVEELAQGDIAVPGTGTQVCPNAINYIKLLISLL